MGPDRLLRIGVDAQLGHGGGHLGQVGLLHLLGLDLFREGFQLVGELCGVQRQTVLADGGHRDARGLHAAGGAAHAIRHGERNDVAIAHVAVGVFVVVAVALAGERVVNQSQGLLSRRNLWRGHFPGPLFAMLSVSDWYAPWNSCPHEAGVWFFISSRNH